jgi:hypothetical protein
MLPGKARAEEAAVRLGRSRDFAKQYVLGMPLVTLREIHTRSGSLASVAIFVIPMMAGVWAIATANLTGHQLEPL